jgi:hypothetical protein
VPDTPQRPNPGDPPGDDLRPAARHAFRVAGSLRALAELLPTTGWNPDLHELGDLPRTADALNRLSIRLAIGAADPDLLSEVTGRTFVQLPTPEQVARLLDPAPGEQAGGNGPDQWRHALDEWRPASPWTSEQWADQTRALYRALRVLGVDVPNEPGDAGEPMWVEFATAAAMLGAYAHAIAEIHLGKDTPGGTFARDIYLAEYETALHQAGLLPDTIGPLLDDDGGEGGEGGTAG